MKKTAQQYRHELKYCITPGIYEILRQRLKAVSLPDPNASEGKYRITSLYFDDAYETAYRDKLNGTLTRKKFRIRTYNLDSSFIRLEEKCKDGNVGYKKNAVLTLDEYRKILIGETAFLNEERFLGTSAEDYFWSVSAVKLKPSVVVDYIREPYLCRTGNVRITFDMCLSVGNTTDMFDEKAVFYRVFPGNDIILEVKYDSYLPLYIEEVLRGLPLQQESVSKFVLCKDKARQIHINNRTLQVI